MVATAETAPDAAQEAREFCRRKSAQSIVDNLHRRPSGLTRMLLKRQGFGELARMLSEGQDGRIELQRFLRGFL